MKQLLCSLSILLFLSPGRAQDTVGEEGLVIIRKGPISASIKSLGAELVSLKNDVEGMEYIWQGDADNWTNSSPILFPIVGSLKEGKYLYNGEVYEMAQHGFAKERVFNVINQAEHQVAFSLKASESTIESYPFDFELQVTYTLLDRELLVSYKVINQDGKAMYFSIGGHPGFNVQASRQNGVPNDHLVFDKEETARIFSRKGKFLDGGEIQYLVGQSKIPINQELFKDGALIFFDLGSNRVEIHRGSKSVLTLSFEGFPYLALWSKPDNPGFICVEPWYGLPDFVETNQKIADKKGIIRLEPKHEFNCRYSIKI